MSESKCGPCEARETLARVYDATWPEYDGFPYEALQAIERGLRPCECLHSCESRDDECARCDALKHPSPYRKGF